MIALSGKVGYLKNCLFTMTYCDFQIKKPSALPADRLLPSAPLTKRAHDPEGRGASQTSEARGGRVRVTDPPAVSCMPTVDLFLIGHNGIKNPLKSDHNLGGFCCG